MFVASNRKITLVILISKCSHRLYRLQLLHIKCRYNDCYSAIQIRIFYIRVASSAQVKLISHIQRLINRISRYQQIKSEITFSSVKFYSIRINLIFYDPRNILYICINALSIHMLRLIDQNFKFITSCNVGVYIQEQNTRNMNRKIHD